MIPRKVSRDQLSRRRAYLINTKLGWFVAVWHYETDTFEAHCSAEQYAPAYAECSVVVDCDLLENKLTPTT